MSASGEQPVAAPEPDLDAGSAALDEAVALAFRVLKGVMVVLVSLFLLSGFFTVQPNEQAFVRVLGELDPEPREPGLHPALPLVSQVVTVDLRPRRQVLESFDLPRTPEELVSGRLAERQGGLDPAREGYLLSGDANVVHVAFAVRVRIEQPYAWLTRVEDTEALVEVLAERAVVQAAAHRPVDSLLGAGKSELTREAGARLQASFEQLALGLKVVSIDLERDLVPPPQVRAAFEGVTKAAQERDRLRAQAQKQSETIAGQGQTEAARIKARAESEAKRIEADAKSVGEIVASLRPEWRRDSVGLQERLVAQAMREVFDKVAEKFVVTDGPLRIRLGRDVRQRTKTLEDKARKATERGY